MVEEEYTTEGESGGSGPGSGEGTQPQGAQGSQQQQPQHQQSQQPSQQGPHGGPQQQQYYQAPSQPMFSSGNLKKMLGMVLLVGVIMMFVGAILVSGSGYVEVEGDDKDSADLKRNLNATGLLLASIGIFAPAIISSYAFYSAQDLSDQQEMILVMLIGVSFIAMAILVNTMIIGLY